MDTQVSEHLKETPESEAKRKADFAEYLSRKGKPLELDGEIFEIGPNDTAAEAVEVWKEDSEMFEELFRAVLDHAPKFCELIADQWEARKMQDRIHEVDRLLQDYESLPDKDHKLVLSYVETGRVPEEDKAAFDELLRERGGAAPQPDRQLTD